MLRFSFYRDGFRALLMVSVLQVVAILVLIFMAAYFANRPAVREYFTVDNAGRIVKLEPMEKPYLTESALLSFASRAVSEVYTFDAENYRQVMNNAAQYFTPDGHVDFVKSMEPQIKYVVDGVLIGSGVPNGTPVIIDRGKAPNGVYAWKVKVPVVVTFRTQTTSSSVKRIVTLIIVNRATFETPYGVGISSFTAKDI